MFLIKNTKIQTNKKNIPFEISTDVFFTQGRMYSIK